MLLLKLNPIEPPWYGPVCPVVWEGRRREASPYPDLWSKTDISYKIWFFRAFGAEGVLWERVRVRRW
jgi:hypothetical protein